MSSSPRVIIIGGVAGGMSCATRLRRLNEHARITVFEKGPYVSYANCGIPYALGGVIADRDKLLLQTPESFKARFNVDVFVNTEVMAIDREKKVVRVRKVPGEVERDWLKGEGVVTGVSGDGEDEGEERRGRSATGEKRGGVGEVREVEYDKVVMSMGAKSRKLDVEGIDGENVFHLATVEDLDAVKEFISKQGVKRSCVIGGGFIGVETAENLRLLGLEVAVVDINQHILPPVDMDVAALAHAEMRKNGVRLALGAKLRKIEKTRVLLEDGGEIQAELVMTMPGVIARTELAKKSGLEVGKTGVKVNAQMQTSDPDIYAVGDMVETEHRVAGMPRVVALAGPANRQGRLAADHICGLKVAYRGNVGTAACKVFDTTVAITGLSVSALRRLGKDPLWVSAHPPSHAGYYPGAQPIYLKIAFEKNTGLLLGAQAVGKDGADKRIDVLATAIQGNMTVFDLEHLELCYAPPYGSAKDAVNMVGFIAGNLLRGDVKVSHSEDLDEGDLESMQVVDVRSPAEFAKGHLKGAININVNTLRDKTSMLDKTRPVLSYCQVGYRGYVATRILEQAGFNAVNLDGGYKTVVETGLTRLLEGPPTPP